ncbi:MAG TPA: ClpXP protease specificity-enhancing factor SspB [Stellaceae bacterium]|nr:ClpXP protease specificity-enhancing factor SspB [Stellaceae bacterium]
MAKPALRYDKMVETALRGVAKEALAVAAQRGLPGAHHFYVTFRTDHPGVEMPDFLRAQYPTDMTIVLQHQFWGLEVDDAKFAVTLSFHSQAQRLTVPLAALVAFEDPSVRFRLEFHPDAESSAATPALEPPAKEPAPPRLPEGPADVVRLDAFRKK